MDEALTIARLVLVAVFLVAGVAKLADLAGSRAAMAGFGVPEHLAAPIGTLLPLAELATAALLLEVSTARAGAAAALGLLVAFCVGITVSMARGESPDCHCFGQLHSEPVGPRVLARNLALVAVAAFALTEGAAPGADLLPSPNELDGALAAVVASGAVAAVLIALGALAYLQLLRNHGRLLLRVESLEGALRARGIPIPQAEASAPGLPVGSPAPSPQLERIDGELVTIDAMREKGKPLLVVFTDPNCGPCRKLAPALATWYEEADKPIAIAVVSRGPREATAAEFGDSTLASSVVLEKNMDASKLYEATATPSAVLIDASGRVGSPVAAGDQAILQLARNAVAPALQVQRGGPPPDPPKAGDQLPLGSAVSDLEGRPTDLGAALDGRDRLVLFWDPRCGFCKRMLPDLLEWEAHNPDRVDELLVISKNGVVENAQQEITAQTVLDDTTTIGRAINFRGTPSALRVDGDGKVLSAYAIGAEAVLALARDTSQETA